MNFLKYCMIFLLIVATTACATNRREIKTKMRYFNAVQYNKGNRSALEKKVKKQMIKKQKRKVRENVVKPR